MIRIGFRRNYAFWYKDIKKAEEVFNWLINENYNKNQIIRYMHGRNEWIIEYENGDIIRFIPAITSINVLPDDKGNYEVDFKADSDFTNLQIILIV